MFAIIETGGKQYRVEKDDVIEVERLEAEQGATVALKVIMTGEGESITVYKPTDNKTIEGTVVCHFKAKKVVVFKYKAKKNVRKKQGHRQYYTRIKIGEIK